MVSISIYLMILHRKESRWRDCHPPILLCQGLSHSVGHPPQRKYTYGHIFGKQKSPLNQLQKLQKRLRLSLSSIKVFFYFLDEMLAVQSERK